MKKRILGFLFAVLALAFANNSLAQNRVIVQGEDEDEFKRTLRMDTKGKPEIVQAQSLLDGCEATDGWTALSNDTTGIEVDLDHVQGAKSLEFDKVDGTDSTVFGGVQRTLSPAVDVAQYMSNNGYIVLSMNLSSIADIDYCLVRLGTDASNYNEWRVDDDSLSIGWNQIRFHFFSPSTAGNTGSGISAASVAYEAVACAFDLETSTLADIRIDNLTVISGLQTSSDTTSQVPAPSNGGGMPVDIAAQSLTAVKVSKDASANTLANPIYVILSDATTPFHVVAATSDDLSKALAGIKVEAVAKFDDGTALDTGKIGATGLIEMEDGSVRPGENATINAREVKISHLGVTEPGKTGPTAVDDTALSATTGTVILGPVKTLGNGRFCVYVKNVGGGAGNDISDAEIYDSPDGTSGWVDTNTFKDCDGLAAGQAMCKYCTNDAWGWVQVKARCATGENTTVDAWLRQEKR